MKFSEVVSQTLVWLQREGRVSYRALKLEFDLNDDVLDALKEELIEVKELAVDKDGKMLVWTGNSSPESRVQSPESEKQRASSTVSTPDTRRQTLDAAERRQLTVMFCDLVDSTALSARLDPEELREVVHAYQQICAEIIQPYEGYIAQYLGDGILVYFGYPAAHEDDAQRAVRAGLEIVTAFQHLSSQHEISSLSLLPQGEKELRKLQVRIGIHTGLVVVGEIGGGIKRELLALGETPNIAARIQSLSEPNTVIISAATYRLVERQFESQPFGSHLFKGIAVPVAVYHIQSERQSTSPLAGRSTLTPLVGREQEIGLLSDRWEQAKEGRGQVILLSGEPGIGKSRLAYTLREQVTGEGSLLFEARCSPYHQHSAFYPLIDVMQRTLLLNRQDSDEEKITKLERTLTLYGMQESMPLFTSLLSLPTPPQYPPLMLTPQKQKERTLQVLIQLLISQAERQATVSVWEDLHWADPSSLEFLSLLIEQIPTTNLLLVLTFRPEFISPWKPRSHISQLVLNRLGKKQVEAMIEKVTVGKELSTEVIEQILSKTDGVPLFVEEITKSVIESVTTVGAQHASPSSLAIPATLQEALLARLDRLSEARQVAQLGATLGREFSHELLQAVTPLSETGLHAALAKLVEAEILYQRGVGEQARYFFKHALIQDTAYQSLLKSTRQQYHQQIAQVLEERFPDNKANQPELLAHHYTEAGQIEQAIPYWQQAGERATQRSAYVEAVAHLTRGLELLKALPNTPGHVQQELLLQTALGPALMFTKGLGAPEVGHAYTRARELCQQVDEAPQLLPVLFGLWRFYMNRADFQTGRELGEQFLRLAQRIEPTHLVGAHYTLGVNLFWPGEFASARAHLEQGIALYNSQQHHSLAFVYGTDPGISCRAFLAWTLWALGHPDQGRERVQEALALAKELSHPFSLALAHQCAAISYQLCQEAQATQEQAEALLAIAHDRGFPHWVAQGTTYQGWALTEQGHAEEGLTQIRQGLTAHQDIRAELHRTYLLGLLAEAYGKMERLGEGLNVLAEVLALVDKTGERWYAAELHRLKGELTLQSQASLGRVKIGQNKSEDTNPQSLTPDPHAEAEVCFLKAIDIARKQQAKSLELRAVMSLVRLRQQQASEDGSRNTQHESRARLGEAHRMLAEIYDWFTEGFDTKDLREARALLDKLA